MYSVIVKLQMQTIFYLFHLFWAYNYNNGGNNNSYYYYFYIILFLWSVPPGCFSYLACNTKKLCPSCCLFWLSKNKITFLPITKIDLKPQRIMIYHDPYLMSPQYQSLHSTVIICLFKRHHHMHIQWHKQACVYIHTHISLLFIYSFFLIVSV